MQLYVALSHEPSPVHPQSPIQILYKFQSVKFHFLIKTSSQIFATLSD